ncbi:MAG TPA: DUF3471 domain-containing protein, partial [Candidatus Sulfotelmatobacter sp.]|nr:DUF3471 domain-containing protein [Candidatus Sulfotelmatobacter sp.]
VPFLITESNQVRTFLYKYYQKTSQPCAPAERLAWAKFTFAGVEEQVVSSEGVIGNVGWSLKRVAGEPEPQVTFALVPLSMEPVALKLPPVVADEYVGQYLEPAGTTFHFGRDGETFVASWAKGRSGGWGAVVPEVTNVFLGLPTGTPHYTFRRDSGGVVTGLVTRLQGAEKCFAKVASQLPPRPAIVQLEPKVYAALPGQYKGAWGGIIVIDREGEQLFWQNPGIQARVPLYPASATNFFFKAVDSSLTFERNDKGEVTKFRLHFCGGSLEAVRLKGP